VPVEQEIEEAAFWIAVEFVAWARAEGWSVADIYRAIGRTPTVNRYADAVLAVERSWLDLHGYTNTVPRSNIGMAWAALQEDSSP
jgi:hypothetical protein